MQTARCLGCGYALRGLARPVCPECGRGFDLNDPGTYSIPGSARIWRSMAAPPALWSVIPLFVMSLCLIEWAATATPQLQYFITYPRLRWATAAIALISIDYALRWIAIRRVQQPNQPTPATISSRRPRRWAMLPAFLCLLLSLPLYNWPQDVRFALSRNALAERARRDATGDRVRHEWVGLYRMQNSCRESHNCPPRYFFHYDIDRRQPLVRHLLGVGPWMGQNAETHRFAYQDMIIFVYEPQWDYSPKFSEYRIDDECCNMSARHCNGPSRCDDNHCERCRLWESMFPDSPPQIPNGWRSGYPPRLTHASSESHAP